MRNPIFKKAVDEAFAKLAWPFNLDDVSTATSAGVREDIARGRAIGNELHRAVQGVPDTWRAGKRFVEGVLAPAGQAVAKPFYSMLRGAGDYAVKHPALARGAVGAALLAPILGSSFQATKHRHEDSLMNLRQDPGRDITASLEAFMEKKAGTNGPGWTTNHMPTWGQTGNIVANGFVGGIGSGLAQKALEGVGSIIGGGLGAMRDMFLTDRARKNMFNTVIQTDVILVDKLEANPQALEFLKEAYGTMCRFAPSLTLDVNAVRSFLREVVVGGSGVNYATIKNLIETEKAFHDAHRAK